MQNLQNESPSSRPQQELQLLLSLMKAEARRRSFWRFCLDCDPEFFKKRPFLKTIAEAMQRVAEGKIRKLAVCLPPRAGKSYIASLFIAWLLGKFPTGSVMRNCCTARLYNKFSYDVRAIVEGAFFQDTFPDAKLQDDKQSLEGWNLTRARQVSYFGAGVGGTVIGFGATLIAMTDDLFKSLEDAMSETVQENTWRWYESVHKSRMETQCPAIDIGTRWTVHDVIGKNIESKYYDEVVIIPAMDEDGRSFCEDVKSTAEYKEIKATIDPDIWEGEYMQQPREAKGILFRKSDMKRFSLRQLQEQLAQKDKDGDAVLVPESKLGYIDVADEGDDALSFPIGFAFEKKIYIVDWIFTEDTIDITVPLCAARINELDVDYVRIETNNQGGGFKRDLARIVSEDRLWSVKNKANKHTRILMESGFIKRYCYFLTDEEMAENKEYRRAFEQLCGYQKSGDNRHDDAPDAMAGLTKFVQSVVPHLFEVETEEEDE